MKLQIVVKYRTPSLNVTKRQHWTAQMLEKRKAFTALLYGLSDTEYDLSIQTTSPEGARICSMAFDTLASYKGMNRGA